MSTIKSKENLVHIVQNDDLIPLVNYAGDTPQSVTPKQILKASLGNKIITIGDGGIYPNLTEAFAVTSLQSRYDVIYETGTATFTNRSSVVHATDGADWKNLPRGNYWLRIPSIDLYIPLVVVAPIQFDRISRDNTLTLKYQWESASGAVDYQIIKPRYDLFTLLPGQITEPVGLDAFVPPFTSVRGVDRFASIWNGRLDIKANEPGVYVSNLTWGNNEAQDGYAERCLVECAMSNMVADAMPHTEIIVHDIECGAGNGERDGVIFGSDFNSGLDHYRTLALVDVQRSNIIGMWDGIVITARNFNIADNKFILKNNTNEDYTPTPLVINRNWINSAVPPGLYRPEAININFKNNICDIESLSGGATSRLTAGIEFTDNGNYLSGDPIKITGQVTNNHFKAIVDNVYSHCRSVYWSQFWKQAPNAGRLICDNNLHDLRQLDGTIITTNYYGATSFGVAPLEIGPGERNVDGSNVGKIGNFLPGRENHGISSAISTGGTIAHGLGVTPTYFDVTPNGVATDVIVIADDTNLTVTFGGGGSPTFAWKAER